MQRVATELYKALQQHAGVALTPLVLHSSWRWTHLRMPLFMGKALWQIRRAVERGEVDVVLFSSMVTAALALPLRPTLDAHGVLAAAIVHGRDVTLDLGPYQRLVPRIFGALDAVLPVSRATGVQCLERGLHAEALHVVPNGVKVDRFAPRADRRAMRQALQEAVGVTVPEEALLLCSVGRQVRRKGFAWFVENVLPLLPPDVHYWLAGDGPEAEAITAAAARKGIQARVRLLGRVSEALLETLYRGADLFVMPNIPVPGDMEGFGVVMLEAGLCGLPTVASRLEGITDVVAEGQNGHLVESGDAWAFSEAILRYHHHGALLQAASERSASYVARTFSWQAVADEYVQTLQGLTTPADLEHLAA